MSSQKLNRNIEGAHKALKVGMVGATGMVGKSFIETLEQRNFPVAELRPFASENSLGKSISLQAKQYPIQVLKPGCFEGLDLVFFSSGDDISKEWAPQAVASGAWAVDNSAAFRMDPKIHLVVPEVNGDLLDVKNGAQIIANPNCSTIQLVVALKPLLEKFGISDVKVSSYQAVSGAGQPAYDELLANTEATVLRKKADGGQELRPKASHFTHQIAFNCIPQIGSFNDQGYTSEEWKIMYETRKILRADHVRVSAMAIRVPVLNAHAESVWVTLDKEVSHEEFVGALDKMQGLVVQDNPKKSIYPMQIDVSGKDPVYVGRIHKDIHDPKTWIMWIVSDNIRKGAALNGIQIAEKLFV
jgi:aspartate-semialdehyde dehydrogenase